MAIRKGFVMDGIRPNRIYLNNEEIQSLQFGSLEWSRSIKLTNAEHKMSDLYPDEYATMKELPQDIQANNISDMSGLFSGCAAVTSLPAVWTGTAADLTDFLKGTNSDTAKKFIEGQDFDLANIAKDVSGNYKVNMLGGDYSPAESIVVVNVPHELSKIITPTLFGFSKDSPVNIYFRTKGGERYLAENAKKETKTAPENGNLASVLYPSNYRMMKYTPDKIHYESNNCLKSAYEGCGSLIAVEFIDIAASCKPITIENMFSSCSSLQEIDLTSFDLGDVASAAGMCRGCGSLERISLPTNFSPTTLEEAFANCRSMVNIDLSSLDLSKTTSFKNAFYDCSSLSKIILPTNLAPKYADNVFNGCEYLSSLSPMNMKSIVRNENGKYAVADMFKGCEWLKSSITFRNAPEAFVDEVTPADLGKTDLVIWYEHNSDGLRALSPNTPITEKDFITLGESVISKTVSKTLDVGQELGSTNIKFATKDYGAVQLSATISVGDTSAPIDCYFVEDSTNGIGKPVLVTPNSRYNKEIRFVMTAEAKKLVETAKEDNVSVRFDATVIHNASIEENKQSAIDKVRAVKIISINSNSVSISGENSIKPGMQCWISNGTLSEFIQTKDVVYNNGTCQVVLTNNLKNTYDAQNTSLYYVASLAADDVCQNGTAWKPTVTFKGEKTETKYTIPFETTQDKADDFTVTGDGAFSSDGYFTLVKPQFTIAGIALVATGGRVGQWSRVNEDGDDL